jgi:hypothetical protein
MRSRIPICVYQRNLRLVKWRKDSRGLSTLTPRRENRAPGGPQTLPRPPAPAGLARDRQPCRGLVSLQHDFAPARCRRFHYALANYHLDRTPRELATKEEWRDPEDVSRAMLIQGIFSKLPGCYPLPRACVTGSTTNSGLYSVQPVRNTLRGHHRLFQSTDHAAQDRHN